MPLMWECWSTFVSVTKQYSTAMILESVDQLFKSDFFGEKTVLTYLVLIRKIMKVIYLKMEMLF